MSIVLNAVTRQLLQCLLVPVKCVTCYRNEDLVYSISSKLLPITAVPSRASLILPTVTRIFSYLSLFGSGDGMLSPHLQSTCTLERLMQVPEGLAEVLTNYYEQHLDLRFSSTTQ